MDGQSPDAYDDNSEDQGESWEQHTPSQTSPTASNAPAQQQAKSIPMQKRRRVTRACDECRRKKIKCDGKQPCTHCTVYSYECTYDQPSNRRRNPAPQYIEGLEHRVHRAETLLHMLMPNLNLNDPSIDVAVAQGFIPGLNENDKAPGNEPKSGLANSVNITDGKDTNLESMVRAIGQLDMDEQGHWDYHGHSSGLSFVRRMREQLGDLMGPETKATPFVKSRPMSQVFDSPKSTVAESPMESMIAGTELPPEQVARELCTTAMSDASVLLRSVHTPTFWRSFDRLYATSYDNYTNEDHKFLPLVYSVLATGCLFGKDERSGINQCGYETAIDQGFKYFKAARHVLDIADCRDLTSIQAVCYMIIFLQCSAKLSQCYAYVGVALRCALRMGLHRSARSFARNFNPVEAETRKRVFWTIRKMDIYIGAMLGLPQTLSDEDIDQDLPIEVDDEYITEEGILPMPDGTIAWATAFNAHLRLVTLLTKIVRKVYPIQAKDAQSSTDRSYAVPFSAIRELENDLENWKRTLPPGLDSFKDSNPKTVRTRQLLRLAYAHAQSLLYRPFLHFIAVDRRNKTIDQRAYTLAASYVNLSRNIVHLCVQMKQEGLLNGAHWFVMYTTFFAVMSLVYFAAENPDNATTQAVMKDAKQGRDVLASLAKRSMAADRCAVTLEGVFGSLPDWLREGRQNPVASKKRRSPNSGLATQATRSHPDIATAAREEVPPGLQQRASTFPRHSSNLPTVSTPGYDQRLAFAAAPPPQTPTTGPYTPTTPSFGQGAFPDGSVENTSPNGIMPYSATSDLGHQPNLPDLSAMMFPSSEPFNYPNQPLTTFENHQYAKDPTMLPDLAGSNAPSMMPPQATAHAENDNLEAQFYTLPPYMMQQAQQAQQTQQAATQRRQPQMQQLWDMGMTTAPSTMATTPLARQRNYGADVMGGGGEVWNGTQGMGQNHGFSNVNLNDIFGGEEWNGLLMDQYRP